MREKVKLEPFAEAKMYFYFAARGLGVALILSGLYLALSVFGLVKTMIEDPETLMAHVNAWVQPMELDAEAAPTELDAEAAPTELDAEAAPMEVDAEAPPAEVSALSESDAETLGAEESPVEINGQQVDPSLLENARSPVRRAERRSELDDPSALDLVTRILDALESGNLARVFAVFVVFLFAWLLVKLPLQLLRIGVALATDSKITKANK